MTNGIQADGGIAISYTASGLHPLLDYGCTLLKNDAPAELCCILLTYAELRCRLRCTLLSYVPLC
jgi:hypothetical protein